MTPQKGLGRDHSGGTFRESFKLEIEKVTDKNDNSGTDSRNQIITLNSGGGIDLTTAVHNNPTGMTISSRNHPSFNIGSFNNVDDSTIQLDTIAPIKPASLGGPPQSTKNAV